MKKFFVIISVLFIIILIGLFVFILTLDVNQYKPRIIDKIEQAIQKDVKIGNISLSIFPPMTITLNGISVKDVNKTWDDVLLEAGSLDARVKLVPLIRRDIQVEHLLIRDLDMFFENKIKLGVPEAVLKNISLYGPINIDARLSLFGRGRENIILKTLLYPELETKNPYIKNLDLRIDLASFGLGSALEALGRADIAQKLIGKEIRGKLAISAKKIYLDPKRIYDSDLYVELSKGMTDALPIKGGIRDIEVNAELNRGDLIIEGLTGDLAGGTFSGRGAIRDVTGSRDSNLNIKVQDVNVARLLPDAEPGKPYLEARLNMDINSSAGGLTTPDMLDILAADGSLNLDKAVLRNMNILTVALNKLNMLPGVVHKLRRRLPERYRELLREKDTFFRPIEAEFNMENRVLFFQKTVVESDAFYLVGTGYIGIDGGLNVNADLFIPRDLSEAFIDAVHEFGYLQNSEGMITMPLDIGGRFPDISVRPDLDYVIQRLAVSKGQELLESIFRKDRPEEPGDEPESGAETEGESRTQKKPEKIKPEEAIIRTIFDILTTPQDRGEE